MTEISGAWTAKGLNEWNVRESAVFHHEPRLWLVQPQWTSRDNNAMEGEGRKQFLPRSLEFLFFCYSKILFQFVCIIWNAYFIMSQLPNSARRCAQESNKRLVCLECAARLLFNFASSHGILPRPLPCTLVVLVRVRLVQPKTKQSANK